MCSTGTAVGAFAWGNRPSDGAQVIALNLPCLQSFGPDGVPIRKVDGASR